MRRSRAGWAGRGQAVRCTLRLADAGQPLFRWLAAKHINGQASICSSLAGLLQRREGRRSAFPAAKQQLRLLLQQGEQIDEASPQDIHYTFAGYAPLSVRLVQHALSGGRWLEDAALYCRQANLLPFCATALATAQGDETIAQIYSQNI